MSSDPDKMVRLGAVSDGDGLAVPVHRDYEDLLIGGYRLTPEDVGTLEFLIGVWRKQVNEYLAAGWAEASAALDGPEPEPAFFPSHPLPDRCPACGGLLCAECARTGPGRQGLTSVHFRPDGTCPNGHRLEEAR